MWRRGSPTSVVVGLQQPTCFIHHFFILAGSKSPGGFSWTISLRFRNQILLYSAVMLYLLTIPGSNLNYFVLPVGRCLLFPQLPGKQVYV